MEGRELVMLLSDIDLGAVSFFGLSLGTARYTLGLTQSVREVHFAMVR